MTDMINRKIILAAMLGTTIAEIFPFPREIREQSKSNGLAPSLPPARGSTTADADAIAAAEAKRQRRAEKRRRQTGSGS